MHRFAIALTAALITSPSLLLAHGDVTPQAVDTSGLPELGEEWLAENPWRDPESEYWARAVEVGASGYNQNCARCHGLEAISGGLAPDLRYLEAEEYGDEWFLERFIHGYTQNGTTKMPAFGELLGQEAAWAIRTYIEARPDDGALDNFADDLNAFRDRLNELAGNGASVDEHADELSDIRAKLQEIAGGIETGSGAPLADSVASRAVAALDGSSGSIKNAADIMKVGLSAAE